MVGLPGMTSPIWNHLSLNSGVVQSATTSNKDTWVTWDTPRVEKLPPGTKARQILYNTTFIHALLLVLQVFSQKNKSTWSSLGPESILSLINQSPKGFKSSC